MNQAYLLSLFMGGPPQTNRMARIIARCLLLGEEAPSAVCWKCYDPRDSCLALMQILQKMYCKYPSLLPIISLLSPPSGSEAIFDIQGNADNDNYYEELSCYLDILAKVLTDIEGYVLLEKQQNGEQASPVKDRGSPMKEKLATALEQIRTLLDGLHGTIGRFASSTLDVFS